MHDAGLAEIERAKSDGRWEAAYAGPATIEVPDDLAAALAAEPKAQAMFELLTKQNRYAVLYRVTTAKRAGDAAPPHRRVRRDACSRRDAVSAEAPRGRVTVLSER